MFNELLEVRMQIQFFDGGLERAEQADGQAGAARRLKNIDATARAGNSPRKVKGTALDKFVPLGLANEAAGMPASRCRSLAPLDAAD